ncbi:type II toxin-antitoxin system VapC family toxin [Pseudomethylobacillus aquaticus]|uniref:Ribonuclease VapC n=1 Tax=Pseudomethylobacillus aquaticus TaxID=2676064 RepID=A0A3N0V5U1_9PROT|nr:type II toxin-antitoxin system VapC family toxin [Pseudomethylobacillus aquaticus]ROH88177.1 type II toxin-antitoxin system VapC family toxin [Pseudomethylobacillus aquaticus]
MNVLADTSVWVDHLRDGDAELAVLLQAGRVCCHPMILGELACGNLKNRHEVLGLLRNLTSATEAKHEEVLQLIERYSLMGKGISLVDVHLLAACMLTAETRLWTRDRRLASIAQAMDLGFIAAH